MRTDQTNKREQKKKLKLFSFFFTAVCCVKPLYQIVQLFFLLLYSFYIYIFLIVTNKTKNPELMSVRIYFICMTRWPPTSIICQHFECICLSFKLNQIKLRFQSFIYRFVCFSFRFYFVLFLLNSAFLLFRIELYWL